jgi:heme exporter protein D
VSYRNYVIAAYCVFALVMLWDFIAPHIAIRQQRRAARLRLARKTSRTPGTDLPLSRE